MKCFEESYDHNVSIQVLSKYTHNTVKTEKRRKQTLKVATIIVATFKSLFPPFFAQL